jgi:hypothetical protein
MERKLLALNFFLLIPIVLLILSLALHSVFAHIRKSTGMGVLRLKMKAANLTNTEGFMRKSDPFFELSRKIDSAGGATWYVFLSVRAKKRLVAMNLTSRM